MLSIIICSINPAYLEDLRQNLGSVTGVEHEILAWDNREHNYGICRVYNMMAEKAKFPFLCFLHEDIIIQTKDWGQILLEIFKSADAPAIVGIAGGKYKARNLSGWYSGIAGMDFYHISHKDGNHILDLSNDAQWHNNEEQVACIDGVFMAVKKESWQKVRFNEDQVKGFHFYDLDFSLSVSRASLALVTKQIDVIHLTRGGDYGNKWVAEAFLFHEYWEKSLPFYVLSVSNAEIIVAKTWLERLQIEKISFKNKIRWVRQQKLFEYSSLYVYIVRFFLYRPSGYFYVFKLAKKIKRKIF